jgi:hypothetical protein
LFRFAFVYFGLYFFPLPVPGFEALATWSGVRLLGLDASAIPNQPTGSGDTMLGHLQVMCALVLALAATLIWSFVDRRRRAYRRLDALFRVYLRYSLAFVLLSYGMSKVPPMQFQKPGPELLVQTYGDSSPMGLLWRFMGFSPAYTMFAGFAEIVPALLLLFLNFCYDVPVKLYSLHLLVAAILLLLPDVPRLANVLVRNRPAPARVLHVRPAKRWMRWALHGTKAAIVVGMIGGSAFQAYQGYSQYGPGAAKPALYGLWDVQSFVLDGQERPPLVTDDKRWRRLIVSSWGGAIVQQMGEQVNRFTLTHDEQAGTVALQPRGEPDSFTLTCERPEDGRLVLEGPFRGHAVRVELRRAPDASFPIDTRGFRWIQEFPYNR